MPTPSFVMIALVSGVTLNFFLVKCIEVEDTLRLVDIGQKRWLVNKYLFCRKLDDGDEGSIFWDGEDSEGKIGIRRKCDLKSQLLVWDTWGEKTKLSYLEGNF